MAGLAARLSQLRLRLRGSLPWLLLCLLAALAIRRWVWMPTLIQGQSMLPTLAEGEVGGINKLAYLRREPERGDLVGVWTGTELMAKRVVGLPGEQVAVHDGVLWVNGAPLAEPYVEFSDRWRQVREGTIEPGCMLVAGDNRSTSVIAVVGRDRIVGRLVTLGSLWRRAGLR